MKLAGSYRVALSGRRYMKSAAVLRNTSTLFKSSQSARPLCCPQRCPSTTQKRSLSTSHFRLNKNYYSVLGVDPKSTQKEIKKAYYNMAKKYHPDANPDDESAKNKFADAAEAYEVLGDESKRKQYDQLGATGYKAQQDYQNQPGGAQQQGGFYGGGGFHGNIDPNELFEKIFSEFAGSGGRKARRQSMGSFFDGFGAGHENEGRGMDDNYGGTQYFDTGPYKVDMTVRFEEAAKGCNKRLNLEVYDKCVTCDGSGAEPGSKVGRCGHCAGTGVEQVQSGPFVMRGTCRKCGGTGKIIINKCNTCGGHGLAKQKKSMAIAIPAGIENGQTVRVLMGQVEVFVTVNVLESREYKREGWNVLSNVNVGVAQAVLGGAIRVRTLHGEETVVIEPGTSSGEKFTLKGHGIKKLTQYGHGDHVVTLEIRTPNPDQLTDRQRELIEEFGSFEEFEGWANNVEPQQRKKYDKKSRKFTAQMTEELKEEELRETAAKASATKSGKAPEKKTEEKQEEPMVEEQANAKASQ